MSTSPRPDLARLYYAYPATIFVYFVLSSLAAVVTNHAAKNATVARPSGRVVRYAKILLGVFIATYFVQIIDICVCSVLRRQWLVEEHVIVGYLSCILVFGLQLSWLFDSTDHVWFPFCGSWALAVAFEVVMAVLSATGSESQSWTSTPMVYWICALLRCALSGLLTMGFAIWLLNVRMDPSSDEECQSLLGQQTEAQVPNAERAANAGRYGATTQAKKPMRRDLPWETRERLGREALEKRLSEGGNWFQYAKGFMVFFPYIWPVGDRALQLRALAVILCLFAGNVLNLLIPRQTGIVTDSLSGNNSYNPWVQIGIFIVLRILSSDAGLELLRQRLWVPVMIYSESTLTRAAFSHIMHLSADFHDSKSSSDMAMAIRGGKSVSSVVEKWLLQAAPACVDMGTAVIYLSITFGPTEGLVTIATAAIFVILAGRLIGFTKSASRARLAAVFHESYVQYMGLTGWHTVSAFNRVDHEDNRYADAVVQRWLKEKEYTISWQLSVAFKTLILLSGLLASALLAVYRIQNGTATPGQFVMLLMYWGQLSSPLKFFASLGKTMSDDFINAEVLLNVMNTEPSVKSKKGARPFKLRNGDVRFNDVCFDYNGKKDVISHVDFHVPGGQTVAFVGATGAGKSTLLKLLDRFYDVTSGSITIDDQDLRDVDLHSLRECIGVVQQDPMLFDETILNNVRYGNITASDEEVHEACKAASLHDQIMGFAEGYDTRVGERGVKLSGGELQRVAIARAILKRPEIVLLDEATSAVDTDTEQKIQKSFKDLCKGRTTFIIAHRLSTVMNANRILVVEHGEIVEQGTHDDLISANGRYADLWSKQIFIKPKSKSQAVDADSEGASAAQVGDNNAQHATSKDDGLVEPSVSTPRRDRAVASDKASTPPGDSQSGL